ncbi:MAG: dihydrolipoamide acetyltransferase family protein [SAR202 cluster bacterium]|jgi:2-oxoisovalerate dehydrogenase E2 component (dihydrolipoyl transacylase)|nr:dihydrolipoamide acetyltransferase family protein [SAR202 cluster bacterium]
MKIELPHVGESVTEAIIGQWLKQVGDTVQKYDPLVEVVTDKVAMEVPSPATGTLSSILVQEGDTVPMGAVIAEMAVEGVEPVEATKPTPEISAAASAVIDRTGVFLKDVAPVGPTGSGGPMPVSSAEDEGRSYSPAVLRLAQAHDIDLSAITGTGIGGRVTRKDVQSHIDGRGQGTAPQAPPSATDDEERIPLAPVRRMIAENMARSASTIPEAWMLVEVDVSSLTQLREEQVARFQQREGAKLTLLPFVIKAVAESLAENRMVNATWGGDSIVLKRKINIGVAIAAPQGLVVPVIHDTDTMDVIELARAVNDLAIRAHDGRLRVEDVQGGTFTINNTGALGSVAGKAIINHPQVAILNTEAVVKRPVVIDGAVAIRSIMNLCITFDHRVLDGAEAGAFVAGVKQRLERARDWGLGR